MKTYAAAALRARHSGMNVRRELKGWASRTPGLGWRATFVGLALAAVLGAAPITRATPAIRAGTYVEVPNGVHAPETWGARLPAGIAALMGHK